MKNFEDRILEQLTVNFPFKSLMTIGIEQEFFLFDQYSAPVTHEKSQIFFDNLSDQFLAVWNYAEEFIEAVKIPTTNNRYAIIKFDHHPHLLEIASDYFDNLHELFSHLQVIYKILFDAASKVDLLISFQPILQLSPSAKVVSSNYALWKNLRNYRRNLFIKRNEPVDEEAVNYAAVIAASQIHIGGLGFDELDQIVNLLYCLEPQFESLALEGAEPTKDLIQKRWAGYLKTFRTFPLVGFPRINSSWTVKNWIQAMLKTPLYGTAEESFAGLSYIEIQSPVFEIEDFLDRVRDLQIIKPRKYGTIEFRGSVVQKDLKYLMRLAALRLGIAETIRRNLLEIEYPLFEQAQADWYKIVETGVLPPDNSLVFDYALKGLKARGLGEEIFLFV